MGAHQKERSETPALQTLRNAGVSEGVSEGCFRGAFQRGVSEGRFRGVFQTPGWLSGAILCNVPRKQFC